MDFTRQIVPKVQERLDSSRPGTAYTAPTENARNFWPSRLPVSPEFLAVQSRIQVVRRQDPCPGEKCSVESMLFEWSVALLSTLFSPLVLRPTSHRSRLSADPLPLAIFKASQYGGFRLTQLSQSAGPRRYEEVCCSGRRSYRLRRICGSKLAEPAQASAGT